MSNDPGVDWIVGALDRCQVCRRCEKLLPRMRRIMRMRRYSRRTEDVYVSWVLRFLRFHGLRHPRELAEPEIAAFLHKLNEGGGVAAGTQNQALAALLFLYRRVMDVPVSVRRDVTRAKRPKRL